MPTNTKKKIATAAILTLAIPTKPNHVFLGWTTGSASKSVAYTPGSTYTAEEDVTLYVIRRNATTISRHPIWRLRQARSNSTAK